MSRRLDQARRETCEAEMHKGLEHERAVELQQRLEDLQRQQNQYGDSAMRVRQLVEERDHLQARIDSLESQLKAVRTEGGMRTARSRDDNLVSQKERERLHDEKAQVAQELAGSKAQIKQLQQELDRSRQLEQQRDRDVACAREQLETHQTKLQQKSLEVERLALQLDYEKRDMGKVAAEIERVKADHAQEMHDMQNRVAKATDSAKRAVAEAHSKQQGALRRAKKEHKKAKQIDDSLRGLHDENMAMRHQIHEFEIRETRAQKEHERAIREMERRLESGAALKPSQDASTALVSSLQNAFRKESAVLQEIQQMSEGLKIHAFV
eukprot:TRINITY_DN12578_c0_g1_i2.p1 TRINITY_DN12578_c0_g1~~TRINITY_DN12578_c0_g1_i2.p1  ORF type:complete len:324 (+),score=99.73 TRINITY_DN12578_c0_g1_i2:185-1156(+)